MPHHPLRLPLPRDPTRKADRSAEEQDDEDQRVHGEGGHCRTADEHAEQQEQRKERADHEREREERSQPAEDAIDQTHFDQVVRFASLGSRS